MKKIPHETIPQMIKNDSLHEKEYLLDEEVRIPQGDQMVVLEEGDRIRVMREGDQFAPWNIPVIGVKMGDPVLVSDSYVDSSGDFRLKITNMRTLQSTWLLFDDRKEAISHGWMI